MDFSSIIAAMRAFEIPAVGAVTPEMAFFGLAIAFFALATVVCAMAISAAGRARDAQYDASQMLRTVQDYAVEVRQLAAKTEKLSLAGAGGDTETLTNRLNSVRVGSRHDAGEASVEVNEPAPADTDEVVVAEEVVEAEEVAPASAADRNTPSKPAESSFLEREATARLAEATRAASEPRSLLSALLRRA